MGKTKWNDDQKKALFAETKNILVSAGAGSGKTAVLSERVLEKVKNGMNISSLLLLTFTKAAAAEMKERIRKKLIEAAKEEKNELIENAISQIDTSYICTFDSFALSVVRKYHYILDLPKSVSISDDSIMKVTILQIIDEILNEYYESNDPHFKELIAAYVKNDDDNLRIRLLNVYMGLTLKLDIEGYLNYLKDSLFDFDSLNQYGQSFIQDLINKVKEYHYLLDNLKKIVESDEFKSKYSQHEEIILENIGNIKKIDNYDKLIKIGVYFTDIFSGNSIRGIPEYTENRNRFGKVKDKILKVFENIGFKDPYKNNITYDDLINGVYKSMNNTNLIIDILIKLHQRLTKLQKEKSLYVFNDIAKMSIKLVSENEDIKDELKNSFTEIMIDEYQDTSDLQEEFIKYISNDNVYRVGDVKQSIYGFRNANPELFSDKYNSYDDYDEKSSSMNQKIDLALNYRTREEVLIGINDIFNSVMTKRLGGADYKARHQLKYGNKSYELKDSSNNYNVELYNYNNDEQLDDSFKEYEKEAFIIVNDIIDKVNNKYKVLDKDPEQSKEDAELNGQKFVLRDCNYNDFAILISKKTDFDNIKKIFEYFKVPLRVYKDESITSGYDLNIIVNILKAISLLEKGLIDSTEFKYLYVSISRSYFYRTSDEEILLSVRTDKYKDSKLVELLYSIVKRLPYLSNRMIIELILEKFNVYELAYTVGDINKLDKELEFILEFADAHNEFGIDFIKSLEDIIDLTDESSFGDSANIKLEFKTTIPVDEAVNLMTIHASKGLEYKICYFSGLSHEFEKKETQGNFIYHKKVGIVSKYDEYGLKSNFLVEYLKNKLEESIVSEKIRLFYVALTRTKEKAILLTSINREKLISEGDLPNTFQDFVEIALKNTNHLIFKDIDIKEYDLTKNYLNKQKLEKLGTSSNLIETNSEWLNNIPQEEEVVSSSYSKKTHGIKSKSEMDKMNLGTDIHYIFEMLDFNDHDIESQIDQLNISKFLKNKVKAFFKQDLVKNIKNGKVYHEYEFIDDNKHGIIDLMVEYDDHIDIIDFKLKNVTDEAYVAQLNGYKSYIEKVSNKKVYIYLYSIIDEEFLEIK